MQDRFAYFILTYPWILLLALLFLYFIPWNLAQWKRHRNRYAIYALNFLLGWTVVGWILAFVWSLTYSDKHYGWWETRRLVSEEGRRDIQFDRGFDAIWRLILLIVSLLIVAKSISIFPEVMDRLLNGADMILRRF